MWYGHGEINWGKMLGTELFDVYKYPVHVGRELVAIIIEKKIVCCCN